MNTNNSNDISDTGEIGDTKGDTKGDIEEMEIKMNVEEVGQENNGDTHTDETITGENHIIEEAGKNPTPDSHETRKNILESSASCQVAIVDDHPALWDGVALLLERERRGRIVIRARDGAELFRHQDLAGIELVILDLVMPGMDGFNTLRKLSEEYPRIKTLVYTMHNNPDFFRRAIALGARGYVFKQDRPEVLLTAIRNIDAGRLGLTPALGATPLESPEAPEYEDLLNSLTAREIEVLSLVAAGMTSRDIARSLNVKKSTIDKHRENIRGKLGGAGLTELIYIARKNKLF